MGVRYDGLITSKKPGGAIAAYRFVKYGAANGEDVWFDSYDDLRDAITTSKETPQ